MCVAPPPSARGTIGASAVGARPNIWPQPWRQALNQPTASRTNPEDDAVTALDFGIAKIDESRGGVDTRAGVALGTPNYMAPEYLRGDPIDHRVDVYAL